MTIAWCVSGSVLGHWEENCEEGKQVSVVDGEENHYRPIEKKRDGSEENPRSGIE